MAELLPGVLPAMLTRIAAVSEVKSRSALTAVALAVEKQAKINASSGQHRRGTKTPASRGSGPARISGTLVRSITHTPAVMGLGGWETRVGVADGLFSPYNHRTQSSTYGKYLETGLRGGSKYPFLGPAFHMVSSISIYTIFKAVFSLG
jgi:hypothetical protein